MHPNVTIVICVDLVQSRLQEQVQANCRKKNLSSCATQILNMCAALIYMDDWDLVCTLLASKSRYLCSLLRVLVFYFLAARFDHDSLTTQKALLHIQDLFKVDIYQLCFQTCSPKDAGGVGVHGIDHVLLAHPLLLPSPPFQLAKKPTLS